MKIKIRKEYKVSKSNKMNELFRLDEIEVYCLDNMSFSETQIPIGDILLVFSVPYLIHCISLLFIYFFSRNSI